MIAKFTCACHPIDNVAVVVGKCSEVDFRLKCTVVLQL